MKLRKLFVCRKLHSILQQMKWRKIFFVLQAKALTNRIHMFCVYIEMLYHFSIVAQVSHYTQYLFEIFDCNSICHWIRFKEFNVCYVAPSIDIQLKTENIYFDIVSSVAFNPLLWKIYCYKSIWQNKIKSIDWNRGDREIHFISKRSLFIVVIFSWFFFHSQTN